MREFQDIQQFERYLSRIVKKYHHYENKAINFIGEVLVIEAKDKIGHLQEGNIAGGYAFGDWEPLADSTIADKVRQGYIFNADANPLFRTGELKDSIHYDFIPEGLYKKLRLGSDSEIMVYQEEGTIYIPPRSVLGLTMSQAIPLIHYTFGHMIECWITDKVFIPRKTTYGSF